MIRILDLGADTDLSKRARELFQESALNEAGVAVLDAERAFENSARESWPATSEVDVILVTSREVQEAIALMEEAASREQGAPLILFTTNDCKRALLGTGRLASWDVVSTDEEERLPTSILRGVEVAELRRREGRLLEELNQAKALLLKNQKSITVGRLLGSIAHEINNPLEAVANLLYLAQRQSAEPRVANDCIALAEKELQRVGDITRQMLSFHRDSRVKEQILVTGAVETGLVLFETRLRVVGIHVERQYRSVGCLTAYTGELRQIFSNLFANSVDAMPNGGRLIVRVQERLGPHPTLCITVADTGMGMDRETAKRVGDLFFTTKGETGTGLGMWVTRQLVEKHGGTMQIYSSNTPGRSGTVFRMVFREPNAHFKSLLEMQAEEATNWSNASGAVAAVREEDDFTSETMSA